jgi:H+/Cl- antiporter ClcA
MDEILLILRKILPYRLSRIIVLLTLLLATGLYQWIPTVPLDNWHTASTSNFLLRVLAAVLALLLGALALAASLIHQLAKAKKKPEKDLKIAPRLDSVEDKIDKLENKNIPSSLPRGKFSN